MGSITIGTRTVTGINVGTGIDIGTKTTSITDNGTYDVNVFGYAANRISVAVSGGGVDTDFLCFTAGEANSTVGLTIGTNMPTPELYISTDNKETFTQWDGSTVTLENVGDKMYIYGNNPQMASTSGDYNTFTMSGSIAASGDVTSLLSRTGADRLASYSFVSLFRNCTALTTAPVLPATTLAQSCYTYMFHGCTSLTAAPALPATTLAIGCYNHMFSDCTALTTAPALPATTLAGSCYQYMFSGCTSLTTAPALPAAKLAGSCYYYMFDGCSSLNHIEVSATEWNTSATSNWVRNVAATGTFVNNEGIAIPVAANGIPSGWTEVGPKSITISGAGDTGYTYQVGSGEPQTVTAGSGDVTVKVPDGSSLTLTPSSASSLIYSGNYEVGTTVTIPFADLVNESRFECWAPDTNYLCLTANEANSTVGMSKQGTSAIEHTLYISTDGTNWSQWDYRTVTLANIGDKLYVKGDGNKSLSGTTTASTYYYFTMGGSIAASGDVTTLLTTKPQPQMESYTFEYLFKNCTALTSAPTLPLTTLTQSCYQYMFNGCTALTTAPALPATTMVSNCYSNMFYGCTALTTAPALPATTLAGSCYQYMFSGCTSLTTAPALPAAKLAGSCYNYMFKGCTSLTEGADLRHVTTTASSCCVSMYNSCTSLATAYAPDISTWTTSQFTSWLASVAASGTLYATAQAAEVIPLNATNGCPSGWTVSVPSAGYTIAVSANPQAGGTVSGGGTYSNGDSATITATANSGYEFVNWTLNDVEVSTNATYTFTVSGDESYVANFAELYTIAVSADPQAGGTVSGGGNYSYGSSVTLTATPSSGYSFSMWTLNGSEVSTNATYTFTATGNATYVAHFSIPDYLCFTANQANSTVELTGMYFPQTTPSIWKSTDKENWTQWDLSTITLSNIGDKVYLYGENNALRDGPETLVVYGQPYWNFTMTGSIAASGDLTTLLTRTGTTTLTYQYLFENLFDGCTSMTTAPSLPATTLSDGCYYSMFKGCTGLTTAPALPATSTNNYCYAGMFQNCTGLTTAPALPAGNAAADCYTHMFDGCTSLVTAPALPATSLGTLCYDHMFQNCTSLTTAPATLPSTRLGTQCYRGMFEGCSSLTTAPATLPATNTANEAYKNMFKDCTSLTTAPSIQLNFISYAICPSMFEGCTSLVTPPTIVARTIADGAAANMFKGCTSLTVSPDLRSVTSLVGAACTNMFQNCTSLTTVYAPSINVWGSTDNWLDNVAASGTIIKHTDVSPTANSASGVPVGWTTVDAPISVTLQADQTDDQAFSYTYNGTTATVSVGNSTSLQMDYNNGLSVTTDGPKCKLCINGVEKGNGPTYSLAYTDLSNGDVLNVIFDNEPS